MKELLKLLSVNEIVAQIASFLLLFFTLRIFAWKKIIKILDERRRKIAEEFRQIEETKSELAKIKADYEARISVIEETAAGKIQNAVNDAQKISGEMRKQAQIEAERIIRNGRESAKYELSKIKESLKSEIVDMVIKTTGNVIGEKLTGDMDRRMIEDFLRQIDNAE